MVRALSLFLLVCLVLGAPLAAQDAFAAQSAGPGALTPAPAQSACSGAKAGGKTARSGSQARQSKKDGGVHSRDWSFGDTSTSRKAWRAGVPSESLQKRAVGEAAAKRQTVNTASGINKALDEADKKKKRPSGMGLSVDQENSSWREQTPSEFRGPDESIPMESRHVVRAYADVEAAEDLNISVGPELILKNEQHERGSGNKQPDSQLGMGMQFKFGF